MARTAGESAQSGAAGEPVKSAAAERASGKRAAVETASERAAVERAAMETAVERAAVGNPPPCGSAGKALAESGWQSTAAPSKPAAIAAGHLFQGRASLFRPSYISASFLHLALQRVPVRKTRTKLYRSLQITKRGTKSRGIESEGRTGQRQVKGTS
jgi:hypothetical protein